MYSIASDANNYTDVLAYITSGNQRWLNSLVIVSGEEIALSLKGCEGGKMSS